MASIHEIQAWAAPVLAPAAPATLLANSLYQGMTADAVAAPVALTVAIAAAVGTEFTGAIAARAGVEAYRKKKPVHMWLAIGASLIYALFVIYGISTSQHTQAFAGSVFISLVAYLGVAIYSDLRENEREAERQTALVLSEAEAQVRLLDAQRKLQNAQNRQSKSSGLVQSSSGQMDSHGSFDPDKLQWMRDYLSANPESSLSDIVAAPGCPFSSRETARKYRGEITKNA